MAEAVYLLCAVTSATCALMLMRQHLQLRPKRRGRLLVWSSLCFLGLALANAVLFVDLVVLPSVDLASMRAGIGAVSLVALVVGLIWELE